jgi:hypothetical protein
MTIIAFYFNAFEYSIICSLVFIMTANAKSFKRIRSQHPLYNVHKKPDPKLFSSFAFYGIFVFMIYPQISEVVVFFMKGRLVFWHTLLYYCVHRVFRTPTVTYKVNRNSNPTSTSPSHLLSSVIHTRPYS